MVVTEVFGVCMVHSAEEHIKLVEDQDRRRLVMMVVFGPSVLQVHWTTIYHLEHMLKNFQMLYIFDASNDITKRAFGLPVDLSSRYLTIEMMSCKFHLGVMHVTVGRAKKQYSGTFKFLPGGGLEIHLLPTLQDTNVEENVDNMVLTIKANHYSINFKSAGFAWQASGAYSKAA